MQLHMCAVYDSAAQAFGRPFFVPAVGIAIRSFRDEVNRKSSENMMYSNPQDFELHKLAEFDDNLGLVKPIKRADGADSSEVLARAFDLKEPE